MASTNRCFRNEQQGAGWQAGQRPRAHHSSLERLFGQLWRQTWAAWKWEGGHVWGRLRLGKERPRPRSFPVPPVSHAELQDRDREEACGWMGSQDAVTLPALDPVLRAARGPKPFHATKEGGASSLAIQPHREDQQWAGRGRQDPASGATSPQIQAKKPVWPCSLLPIGSLQAGTGARWM